MADKAKHAYGSRANLPNAIASGAVDAYDVLFLNGEDETPAIGWIDKDGNPIIVEGADLSGVEAELATKANIEEVEALESQIATKADAADIKTLETEMATKVDATTVQSMINESTVGVIEVVEF